MWMWMCSTFECAAIQLLWNMSCRTYTIDMNGLEQQWKWNKNIIFYFFFFCWMKRNRSFVFKFENFSNEIRFHLGFFFLFVSRLLINILSEAHFHSSPIISLSMKFHIHKPITCAHPFEKSTCSMCTIYIFACECCVHPAIRLWFVLSKKWMCKTKNVCGCGCGCGSSSVCVHFPLIAYSNESVGLLFSTHALGQ